MRFVLEAMGLGASGGLTVATNLVREMARQRDHEYTVLAPGIPEYNQFAESPNVKLIALPKPSTLFGRYNLLQSAVPRFCREIKADGLLCLGNYVPKRRPCPTAVLMNNPLVVYREPRLERHLTLREKLIVPYARRQYSRHPSDVLIIVHAAFDKDRLVRFYDIHPSGIVIIPCGCPEFPTSTPPQRATGQAQDGTFRFLCLSRYSPYKNFEVLPEALKRLPAYTKRAAECVTNVCPQHHPGARKFVERIAHQTSESKVVNVGWVETREELERLYQSADAYVFPSVLETFSLTYDEAMHAGLPILTSDRDFARERCQDAAIYFDPLNPDSIARAMARMMEDADLRQRLVENGRRILQQAPTWQEIAARFVEVLERTAKGELPVCTESRSQPENQFAPAS